MSDKKEYKFKASVSRIVKFEDEVGISFSEAFKNPSLKTIVIMIKCLSNMTDDEIDEYVQEKGFNSLMDETKKALEKSGFLPKKQQAKQPRPKATIFNLTLT